MVALVLRLGKVMMVDLSMDQIQYPVKAMMVDLLMDQTPYKEGGFNKWLLILFS
jgi:hypothetical protein